MEGSIEGRGIGAEERRIGGRIEGRKKEKEGKAGCGMIDRRKGR